MSNGSTAISPQMAMPYERGLGQHLYAQDHEKTFIDKVLDRKDSEKLRELMKQDNLTRSELLELLYLIIGINTKLVNFSEWDRYLLGKMLAWVRDFVTKEEELIDYREAVASEKIPDIKSGDEVDRILEQIQKHDEHNIKFLIDIFLYLCNSTLSIKGVAFDTLTKSKFEYHYPDAAYSIQQPKSGVMGFFGGKKQ